MGGGGGQPEQSTRVELTPEQKELYKLAMPNLKDFAANPPQVNPDSAVAGFDPLQTQGQEMALASTGGQGQIVGSAADASKFFTSGDVLDPASNPGLQGHIDAAVRPIYDNLTERALPAVRSGATQAGQFGGSRQAIAESLAIRDAGRAAGDTSAKIVGQNYGTGIDAMTKALGLSGSTAQNLTIPGQTTSAVGDVRQNLLQQILGENASKWNYEQMLPLLMGKELIGAAGAMPNAGTVSTANNPTQNPWMQGLGGAAAGASLGTALMPGIGTAAGAGLGALLPFLTR
jgi:hypothetical protein